MVKLFGTATEVSHRHSFVHHNITTTLTMICNINTVPLLLLPYCSQQYVIGYNPSFNQDISNWDVSSGNNFVSGTLPYQTANKRSNISLTSSFFCSSQYYPYILYSHVVEQCNASTMLFTVQCVCFSRKFQRGHFQLGCFLRDRLCK